MTRLDPSRYVPPFISEVVRETDGDIDDCMVCSILMLGYAWTLGELGLGQEWSPRDVIAFREAARRTLGPEKAEGGLTLADGAAILEALDPSLPPLPRSGGPGAVDLDLSFDQLWERLRSGGVAVVIGNPARVKDPTSPLRAMQANDDYAHAVYVDRAQQERAWVMDPLGVGSYKGAWVPREDLRQFMSEFGDRADRGCAVVVRGEQSREARTERALRKVVERREDALAAAQQRIAELEAAQDCSAVVTAARATALDDAVAAIGALPR